MCWKKKASWVGDKVVTLHPEFTSNSLVCALRWLLVPPGNTFGSLPPPGNTLGSMPHPGNEVSVEHNVSDMLCEGQQGRALGKTAGGRQQAQLKPAVLATTHF